MTVEINDYSTKKIKKVMAAVSIGTFMGALDSSIINIALPTISTYFHAPLANIEWIVMSYLLVISSLLLTYGRLGDMYGHKRIYLLGFGIFTAGSLFCGLSPNIPLLIVSRVIQALGAGMLMSMGSAIVTNNTPPSQRGKYLGVIAVAVSVALTTGPILGGFLTTHLGWQSIFYVNIPVGIIGLIWSSRVIPKSTTNHKQPFDILGAVTIFLALSSSLLALSNTEEFGWNSPYIIGLLVAGIVFLLAFVYIEKKVDHPMMDLSLFQNRLFFASNMATLINFTSQFFIILLMPFYLQRLLNLSPSQAGFIMIPMPLMTMVIAPISGAFSDRFDTRYISSFGVAVAAVGIFLLSGLNAATTRLAIMASMAVVGLGFGIFQTPNNSAIMGCVPNNMRGIASGVLATMRNVGMVMGVAIAGTLFSNRMAYMNQLLASQGMSGTDLFNTAFTDALHFAFRTAAIFSCIAIAASLMKGSTRKGTA
jgi:EmrB/QacA subfamily drug resistance transporter